MVNLVDCLGTKFNPLASDKNGVANLEWQIGVEFPHNRGHSRDKGCKECLPTWFWMMKLKNMLEVGKPHSGTNEGLNSYSW